MKHSHTLIFESDDFYLYGIKALFSNEEPITLHQTKSAITQWAYRLLDNFTDRERVGIFSFELINGILHEPLYSTVDYVNGFIIGIPKQLQKIGVAHEFTGEFDQVNHIIEISKNYGIRTICAMIPSDILFKTSAALEPQQKNFHNLGALSTIRFNRLKEQLNSNVVFLDLASLTPKKNGAYEARVNFIPPLVENMKKAGMHPILGMPRAHVEYFGWQDLCESDHLIYLGKHYHTIITFEQLCDDASQRFREHTAFSYAFIFDMIQVENGNTSHEVIQKAIPNLNRLIMCSEYSCRQLARLAPESTRIATVGYVSVNVPQKPLNPIEQIESLGDFYFVIGNGHHYKLLQPTLDVLCQQFPDRNFVVLGEGSLNYSNLTYLLSGNQSDELIDALYYCAQGVIFPSCYEGLGYPWIKSLLIGQTAFGNL